MLIAPPLNYVIVELNTIGLRLTGVRTTSVIDAPLSASFTFSSNNPLVYASASVTSIDDPVIKVLGVTMPTTTLIEFDVPSSQLATGIANIAVTAIDVYGNEVTQIVPVGIYRAEPFEATLEVGQLFEVSSSSYSLDPFEATLDVDQSLDVEGSLDQSFDVTLVLDQAFDVEQFETGYDAQETLKLDSPVFEAVLSLSQPLSYFLVVDQTLETELEIDQSWDVALIRRTK